MTPRMIAYGLFVLAVAMFLAGLIWASAPMMSRDPAGGTLQQFQGLQGAVEGRGGL